MKDEKLKGLCSIITCDCNGLDSCPYFPDKCKYVTYAKRVFGDAGYVRHFNGELKGIELGKMPELKLQDRPYHVTQCACNECNRWLFKNEAYREQYQACTDYVKAECQKCRGQVK